MLSVFQQVLILVLFCTAGYILCKKDLLSADQTKILSALEIYVFGPCMTFNTFVSNFNVTYIREKYPMLIMGGVFLLLTFLFANVAAKRFTKHPYNYWIYHYSCVAPNYGFMGYPLCLALFGEGVLMDMMIFVIPLGIYVNTVGYNTLTQNNNAKLLKQIFTPGMIAIILGAIVGVSGLTLPSVLDQAVGIAADCMSPVSMLLTGIVISQYNLKELLLNKKAYALAVLRLLVIPVAVFGVMKAVTQLLLWVGLTQLAAAMAPVAVVAILTYAMPCGMNTIVFPKLVGEDCKIGASAVLITTLAALATMPLCVHFLIG